MSKMLLLVVMGVSAVIASAQDLQSLRHSRLMRPSRLARPKPAGSLPADAAKDRAARKARAAQRSQFSAGSATAEFERERDALFMDLVREAEICQTNLAEYATYPYWPDIMGVVSNFCEKENCVVVDVGHHFGAWRQGCGKKACVVTCDLNDSKLFVPCVRAEGDGGFRLISRGGAYTNVACCGVGPICCYDSDGRFVEMCDSVDKLPNIQDCLSADLARNYAEQDRWMVSHGFSDEGSGQEAEAKLGLARTTVIDRLEALNGIFVKFPNWKSDNTWHRVCDVNAKMRGPYAYEAQRRRGFRPHPFANEIKTNDAVYVKMNKRFEDLGRSQDRLIEEFVRDLTGLEFGSSTDTNGVLDLKFNLGGYENCVFSRTWIGDNGGVVDSVTLIAEFEASCEQKAIHEKLDQSLSVLLSAIGMDRDALAYKESTNGTRQLSGLLRRPGGNLDLKSVQSFSQRFLITRSKRPTGEYVVTISDQRKQEADLRALTAGNAEREAEREQQRQQLMAIQEELRKAREAREREANSAETKNGTGKFLASRGASNRAVGTTASSVAEKLQSCDFLLNKDFKRNAKFYLCLFSASWCPPCRREMPRIAKTYAETLKNDPDIELIHFSRDQNDEKALAWAKEHDVKFPVVKTKGGNPLDLHTRGIPHLFIVKADGTLAEEGHPMKLFTNEKLRELKAVSGRP